MGQFPKINQKGCSKCLNPLGLFLLPTILKELKEKPSKHIVST
jgi:hypothetical protein